MLEDCGELGAKDGLSIVSDTIDQTLGVLGRERPRRKRAIRPLGLAPLDLGLECVNKFGSACELGQIEGGHRRLTMETCDESRDRMAIRGSHIAKLGGREQA